MMINNKEVAFKEVFKGSVSTPIGYKATGIHCGIRRKRKDLAILISQKPAISAAVYTTNSFKAAPLIVTEQSLALSPTQRALIVNSGNANAFTGKKGIEDANQMKNEVASQFNLSANEVLVASTGIIGEQLPMDPILNGIANIGHKLDEDDNSLAFEEAILTTDTVIKSLAIELIIDHKKVTIGGAAKGSGMIHPNMATMLAFITTDANIEKAALQKLLKAVTDETYNMITVDGDTSTNDMVIAMANGMAGNDLLNETHTQWEQFYQGFKYVSTELAKMIAKDGEGATKLIAVKVEGAKTQEMARMIAKKIIGSNLVKTAVFGADANWGRIVMAIGNSGYQFDENQIDIVIGGTQVVKLGKTVSYHEEEIRNHLLQNEVTISVDLNYGTEKATAWGCDLSYDYVRINASYRT